jgi:pilus assembly protein CpaE
MTSRPIHALVAHEAEIGGQWVADHVPAESGVALSAVVGELAPAADVIQKSDADVLLVACAEQTEAALALVAWWAGNRPARPVVVLAPASPNGFVGRAFAAGADDLVVIAHPGGAVSQETSQELVFALQKAVARRSTPQPENGNGHGAMICVLGPKGGTGKTVTAANLGISLAELGKRVVLVDLDLQFGDLALALGLSPAGTAYDLATAGGSLDAGKVDAYLVDHPSGVRVLMAPTRPDQASSIKIELLRELFPVLRDSYDYVVADTPPGFTPEVIASIDASSEVCMVGTLDAPSLKSTKLGLETLELMGYDMKRVRLVLNRADSNVGVTHNDVLAILGRPPDVLVPSHRDVTRSVNEGVPVVLSQRRSEAAKAFRALAQTYAPVDAGSNGRSSKRSLLTRSRA